MGVLAPFQVIISNVEEVFPVPNPSSEFSTKVEKDIFIEKLEAKELKRGAKVVLKNIGIFEVEEEGEDFLKFFFSRDQSISQLKKTSQRMIVLHWINKS